MKIAFYSDTFPPQVNSISISLLTLATELSNKGHDVSIFTGPEEDKDVNSPQIPDTLKVYRTSDFFSHSSKKSESETIHRDFREILSLRPDIIHIHTPFSVGKQGLRAARLLKIPVIGSHHTFYANYRRGFPNNDSFLRGYLTKKYITWFYNKCQLVITPSKSIANDIAKHGLKSPISIIPDPVNIDRLRPSAQKTELKKLCGLPDFSLVYVGRISYEKRIHELLKVFALLSSKYPKMRLSIIGDGPERQNLENFAKRLNIREKVIFFGLLKDQAFVDAIAANDIFITASDMENQPLPLIEAMAIGLPQVVAKSAIDEYVENGITGQVTEKYSFMELSEEITKLIENPVLREKMSENSKKSSRKYDVKNISKEYERIYLDFLQRKI